ncbi:hypothetical protein G6F50_014864 [Rhizopus delemar]|uniref:DNA mimic protein DMP19 C-terminal domain-containing protein n=1 Tax=Rhizopus delemar TaxID=936053 RepID=A0A9P6Y252_9FUNG|nr:hypothetical protein G6F50_014864 [Rhizopus delemar]
MTDVFAAFRVTDVAFDDDFILLTLADGRRTRQPLRWAPALFEATPEQRAQWVATANGLGVNWPALLPPREDGVVDVPNQVWDDRYEAALARLKAAAWALDALSDEDQQLVALWRMEADINNGGFMQFLCNWDPRDPGRHARVAGPAGRRPGNHTAARPVWRDDRAGAGCPACL